MTQGEVHFGVLDGGTDSACGLRIRETLRGTEGLGHRLSPVLPKSWVVGRQQHILLHELYKFSVQDQDILSYQLGIKCDVTPRTTYSATTACSLPPARHRMSAMARARQWVLWASEGRSRLMRKGACLGS